MATTYIDTRSCNSDYIYTLPRTYSLGTYITIQDNGSNPSFFASNSIIIKTTPGYGFFDGTLSESIRTSKGSLTFTAMTTAWRLVNSFAYTTSGNAVLSTISTTHMFAQSLSLSNLLVKGKLTAGAIDVENAPTIQGNSVVNTNNLISTTEGLGTLGFLSSVPFMNTTLTSTTNGLGGYGYISSTQLQSTLNGLGSLYLSTGGLISTFQGLGTSYVSTSGLVSSVQGLGTFGYISTASLTSTFQGLGSVYLSTGSMTSTVSNVVFITSSNNQSTFQNLGSIYISTPSLVSTIQGISNVYIVQEQLTSTSIGLSGNFEPDLVSTIAGLGDAGYISSFSLYSTVTSVVNIHQSNVSFQLSSLGSLYISSLSLQSTVAGLASLPVERYISSTQLTSTTTGLTASNRADLVSTVVNLASLEYISRAQLVSTTTGVTDRITLSLASTGTGMGSNYISTHSLVSTVTGLGTAGYISVSQLTSTTSNLAFVGSNSIVSTIAGLGTFYISVSQLTSTVIGFSNTNQSNLISTVNTRSNYISTPSLVSTIEGLGTAGYISVSQLTSTTSNLAFVGSNSIVSTIAGLGALNYISLAQLTSTVIGFSNTNQSNLISTVNTLGSNYISTHSLVSTVTGLGTAGYVSLSQLTSTTSNLAIAGSNSIVSTIAGLGAFYISLAQLTSTVIGFSNTNQSNLLSTVNTLGSNYISTHSLVSTVTGLGTAGYVSLSQLTSTTTNLTGGGALIITSTIEGLGTLKYISISQITSTVTGFSNTNQSNLLSTVNTLGSNYISTHSLISTVSGLGTTYISVSQLTSTTSNLGLIGSNAITSTTVGLGTAGYISLTQLTSTVTSFSNTNLSNLISTVNTLGSNYISTQSLISTVAGLGTAGYVSLSQLTSTTNSMLNVPAITSTAEGLGTAGYISLAQLTSTVTSFSNTNRSNLISTVVTLSNYISSQSLISTVTGLGTTYISIAQLTSTTSNLAIIGSNAITSTNQGLGTAGYISLPQLTSTVTSFSNINRSNLISTVNTLGSNYISTHSLISTVTGLGTTYISVSQLTSTTSNLAIIGSNAITSTNQGLGTAGYISLAQLTSTVTSFSNTNRSNLISTVNTLGSNYISTQSLVSTVAGLGTTYISVPQLVSTTTGLPNPVTMPTSITPYYNSLGYTQGQVTTLVNNKYCLSITYSQTLIFYADTNIYTNNYAGTQETILVSPGIFMYGLATDGITLYASINNKIISVNIATGSSSVSVLAGTDAAGFNDGPTSTAIFNSIRGLCLDSTYTNLYVCDLGNNRLRKINLTTLIVSTVAINLSGIANVVLDSLNEYAYVTRSTTTLHKVNLSDGSSSPVGTFTGGIGLSLDSTTAYITSPITHEIYTIDTTTGVATLLAGTGNTGDQDGLTGSASFNFPYALAFNHYDRSLYIADTNSLKVRKILLYKYSYVSSLTLQATVANLGESPYLYMSTPSLVSTVNGLGSVGYLSTGYLVSTVSNVFNVSMTPFVSTTVGLGQIYISTSAVQNIAPDSYKVSTLPFSVFRPIHIGCTSNLLIYTSSDLNIYSFNGSSVTRLYTNTPISSGIACDLSNIYSCLGNTIISMSYITTTTTLLAGNGNAGFIDGTVANTIRFDSPQGLCIDSTYTYLYVCDTNNNALRRVQLLPTYAFNVTTIATPPNTILSPNAIAVDSSNRFAYVVCQTSNIFKIDLFLSNSTPIKLYSNANTRGISLDVTERFAYVTSDNSVYTMDLITGASTLVAGSTTGNVDGYGSSAQFNATYGVVYNQYDSTVYICDFSNSRIRQITAPLYASTSVGLQTIQKVQTIAASNASLVYPVNSNVIANVPSLQLWLDGADPSGNGIRPANGAALPSWVDKSWNGYTQTKTGSPTYSNGQISVGSTNYFTSSYITNYTTQTIFVVGSSSSSVAYSFFIRQSSFLGFELIFYGSNIFANQVFSGNVGNVSIQGSVSINTTYLFTVTLTPTLMSLYVNGILAASSALVGTFPTTTQLIGYADRANTATISEVLMYNSALSASDRKGIEGYLMNKWLLQPYQPTLYPGLQLWLDGADPLATGTPPANGSLTSWTDKSGNGYNGVATGSPTYTNGQISVDPSKYFISQYMPNYTNQTIFVVVNFPSSVNTNMYFISGTGTVDTLGREFKFLAYDNKVSVANRYGTLINMNGSTIAPNTQHVLSVTITPGNTSLYVDGIFNVSSNATVTYYTTTTTIGGDSGLGGTISEVIMYSNALTTSQRQAIEQYLGVKWSINTVSLPLYYNPYTPNTFPGCRLWLDGADASNGTIPNIGTNITTWVDKSGQVTVTGNGLTTANGIAFTGGSTGYSTNLNTNMSNQTTFSVFNATYTDDRSIIGTSGYASGINVGINGTMQINLAHPANDTNGIQVVKTLAGLYGNSGFINSTGSNARFAAPSGLAVDSSTNLYVVDTLNHVIRKVTPAGVVTTYAGSTEGFADGARLSAQFSYPFGIAIDSSGNLYVADYGNYRIRKITATTVTTIAGSNTRGTTNGIGTAASFYAPQSIAIDSSGNIYVAEHFHHIIRKIDTSSNVTTYAGTGAEGLTNGPAFSATFTYPRGLAVDASGNVYVGSPYRIRKISPLSNYNHNWTNSLILSIASRNSNVYGVFGTNQYFFISNNTNTIPTIITLAGFNLISVIVDSAGYAFFSSRNSVIYRLSSSLEVVAGSNGIDGNQDGNLGISRLTSPNAMCIDSEDTIYFLELGNKTMKRLKNISGTWNCLTIINDTSIYFNGLSISDMKVLSGNSAYGVFYFSTYTAVYRVTFFNGSPTSLLLAGSNGISGFLNERGSSARFDGIEGLTIDPVGNIYVADSYNLRVRFIDPASNVSTFATLNFRPISVSINGNSLYVGGFGGGDGLVRYDLPTVSTVAGSVLGSSDGQGTAASFNNITDIAIHNSDIYVSDLYKIRKIDANSNVTTFAGTPSQPDGLDNLLLTARLGISQLAVRSGIVYFSEETYHTIRYTPIINYIVNGGSISVNSNTLFTSLVQTGVSNGVSGFINGSNVSQGSILDIFNPGSLKYAYIGMTYIDPGGYMSKYFVGSIQEVIIYNKLLSMAQRKVIEFYLTQKWIPSYTTNITKDTTSIPSTNSTSPAILLTSSNITVTEIDATGYIIEAATFTASGGSNNGPNYGFYGDATYVTTISDRRLKEDIRNLTHVLDKVSSMQAVNYRLYRDPSQQWIGYIAQDLEVILPELVRTDDSPEKWKSIQYTYLPALIIEAVKELKEKYDRIKHLLTV